MVTLRLGKSDGLTKTFLLIVSFHPPSEYWLLGARLAKLARAQKGKKSQIVHTPVVVVVVVVLDTVVVVVVVEVDCNFSVVDLEMPSMYSFLIGSRSLFQSFPVP